MADDDGSTSADTSADDAAAQSALAGAAARNGQSGSDGTQSGQSGSQSGSDGSGDQAGGDQSEETDWKAEADRWKTHARKHEQRAKENADAAKKLKDIEDKDKTESQKLSEQNDELNRQLLEYKVGEVRRNAAVTAGLPADMVQFITAVETEDANRQAELLAAKVRPSQQQGHAPAADFAQGNRQQAAPPQTPDAWLRNFITTNR